MNQEQSFDGTFTENIRTNTYKNQFANKRNKIIINVGDTQYAVVKHISKKNKWFMNVEPVANLNFDICWTDCHVKQELFSRMSPHQKINHFPGMGILSRKNNLGNNLMQFRKQHPEDYNFFPITWTLPGDYSEVQNYHECRQQGKAQTFIVKPEASCQGRGIFLTRNIQKLKYQKCVIQRYMHKPYLIDGLKFDLRIYVLVAGIDPLRIFVYEEGLARFATEQYRPPRSQNLDNKFMHLTNYAINKENPNFIFNESKEQMDIGHKRSLTSVYKKIAEEGHDVELLKERINDIFIKTLITGYPTLSHSVSNIHSQSFGNDMCFEILGFDIMIDSKLNPYLIEVNYTPSFTADTPLDRHIKKNLISDTLILMGVNQKWKKQMKGKRQREIQERMQTGKRRKYAPQQRKIKCFQQSKKRDEHQKLNSGRFTKIFMVNEQQFNSYKPFYDYAHELYEKNQKAELNSTKMNYNYSTFYSKMTTASSTTTHKQLLYNNYFLNDQPKQGHKKQSKKTQKQDNTLNRSSQMGNSFVSCNKRVSSAKGKRKDKKVVAYQRISSKKSLRQDHKDCRSKKSCESRKKEVEEDQTMQNKSIFQNKNLQMILMKQQKEKIHIYDDFN